MEKLPNIVRERLRSRAAGEHPDADLLTAFAERTLSERERDQVATHLSACTECRQVVSLAMPELLPASTSAPDLRLTTTWFRWPVLRWGALAACVVVVGAAVVIGFRPEKRAQSLGTYIASDKQPSPPVTARQNESAPGKVAANLPEEKQRQTRDETEARLGLGSRIPAAQKPSRAPAQVDAAPLVANQVAAGKAKDAKKDMEAFTYRRDSPGAADRLLGDTGKMGSAERAPSVPPPASKQKVPAAEQATSNKAMNETVEVEAAATPAPTGVLTKSKQARAPAKTAAAEYTNRSLLETAASAPGASMPDLKPPRWTLSEDGLPQRSFDSGKTWEKIQVDHQAGFRALAANGMNVWVGGRSGLLYHSSDIGLHWTRMVPVSDQSSLSDDINRIEFPDALHGKLTTTGGEIWTTADGGRTWQQR